MQQAPHAVARRQVVARIAAFPMTFRHTPLSYTAVGPKRGMWPKLWITVLSSVCWPRFTPPHTAYTGVSTDDRQAQKAGPGPTAHQLPCGVFSHCRGLCTASVRECMLHFYLGSVKQAPWRWQDWRRRRDTDCPLPQLIMSASYAWPRVAFSWTEYFNLYEWVVPLHC